MQSSEINQLVPCLLSVRQFAGKHPAFPESSLRWLIFNKEDNGLAAAIIKIGRRVLIDERKFFDWLKVQNDG